MTTPKRRKLPHLIVTLAFYALTMFICIGVRMIYISHIPQNMTADEADTIHKYIQIQNKPFSFRTFNWNGSSWLNLYSTGLIWEAGNATFESVRYASIIASTLALIIFFFFAFYITNNILLTSLSTLALSSNVSFLNFSRSGWENIYNAIPFLFISFLIISNYKLKKLGHMLLYASILGVSFYLYHPGKLLMVTGFIYGCIAILTSPLPSKKRLMHTFIFTIFLFALLIPGIIASYASSISALDRIGAVSILTKTDPLKVLVGSFVANNQAFFIFWNNTHGRYGPYGNIFNTPMTILYIFSLLVALRRYYRFFIFLVINFFVIQLLSTETPNIARAIHLFPFYYLVPLLALSSLQQSNKSGTNFKALSINLFTTISCIIFLWSFYFDSQAYFTYAVSSYTLNERRPAVRKEHYLQWLNTIRYRKTDMNVSSWEEHVQEQGYKPSL